MTGRPANGRPTDRRIAEDELEAREAAALDRAQAADVRGGPPGGEDAADRVVSPLADADDRVIESALRPNRLADFVTANARKLNAWS